MDYIVVDFEWNQSPYGKSSTNKRLPFEIIEIGAVKLDQDLEYVESFDMLVRPKVYKRLHYMTQELTGITEAELAHGESFNYTIVDFMLWCGDDYCFCTWGDTDLIELQRNMKFYRLGDLLEGPIKYYNIQKLFRILKDPEERVSCALETAVDVLGIEKQWDFHRAVHDAMYTAEVFKQLDISDCERFYSVDYYQNPQSKKEELHLVYDTYKKYISREFCNKEEALVDREVRSTVCYKCDKAAPKKVRWFMGRNKSYYSLSCCAEHGYIRGKIRFKKTDEGRIYAVKTLRLIDGEKAEEIRQMKNEVIEKRREKRHKPSDHEVI